MSDDFTVNYVFTVNIRFLDLDGELRTAPMTMDWSMLSHGDTIDLVPLQEKLKEDSANGTDQQQVSE